jgi:hypothetical protein
VIVLALSPLTTGAGPRVSGPAGALVGWACATPTPTANNRPVSATNRARRITVVDPLSPSAAAEQLLPLGPAGTTPAGARGGPSISGPTREVPEPARGCTLHPTLVGGAPGSQRPIQPSPGGRYSVLVTARGVLTPGVALLLLFLFVQQIFGPPTSRADSSIVHCRDMCRSHIAATSPPGTALGQEMTGGVALVFRKATVVGMRGFLESAPWPWGCSLREVPPPSRVRQGSKHDR